MLQSRSAFATRRSSDLHAVRVSLLVREASLDLRHQVARVGLRRSVLALLLLAKEGRQGDRGKDADDQDDDEELDKRGTAPPGLKTQVELVCLSFLRVFPLVGRRHAPIA